MSSTHNCTMGCIHQEISMAVTMLGCYADWLCCYLCLQERLFTVLLVGLQLFEVDGVVAAVKMGKLHEELVGSSARARS